MTAARDRADVDRWIRWHLTPDADADGLTDAALDRLYTRTRGPFADVRPGGFRLLLDRMRAAGYDRTADGRLTARPKVPLPSGTPDGSGRMTWTRLRPGAPASGHPDGSGPCECGCGCACGRDTWTAGGWLCGHCNNRLCPVRTRPTPPETRPDRPPPTGRKRR